MELYTIEILAPQTCKVDADYTCKHHPIVRNLHICK